MTSGCLLWESVGTLMTEVIDGVLVWSRDLKQMILVNQIEALGLPLSPKSLATLKPFTSITFNAGESNGENSKPEVAKTGLGSSAAMTTVVVAALLSYLGVVNLSSLSEKQNQEMDIADLDVVHVIAQTAHCIAHERTKFSLPPLMMLWMGQASEPSQVQIVKALLGSRDAMLEIRCQMRQMGDAAGIPIEPESQTRLLDATMKMEGVLLAGVPGAGGFDAIFAVTLGDASSTNLTKAWSSHNVLAMLVREDPRGVSLQSSDPRATEITSGISAVHIE